MKLKVKLRSEYYSFEYDGELDNLANILNYGDNPNATVVSDFVLLGKRLINMRLIEYIKPYDGN